MRSPTGWPCIAPEAKEAALVTCSRNVAGCWLPRGTASMVRVLSLEGGSGGDAVGFSGGDVENSTRHEPRGLRRLLGVWYPAPRSVDSVCEVMVCTIAAAELPLTSGAAGDEDPDMLRPPVAAGAWYARGATAMVALVPCAIDGPAESRSRTRRAPGLAHC